MLGAGDALLSTAILPSKSRVDLHPSVCWTSGVEVERAPESAHAAASDRLAIGQMLSGRYWIERELGEGGMGLVYLVRDEQVAGETFAVKVLKQGLDREAISLLREEVRETRKLSHPNIVDVHSVNVDGTALYVLMEYLEGKSLNALLDEEFGRGMRFSHAWPIIEDVGAALAYAHDHNVIHSDLKPANVLVAERRTLPSSTVVTLSLSGSASALDPEARLGVLRRQGILRARESSPSEGHGAFGRQLGCWSLCLRELLITLRRAILEHFPPGPERDERLNCLQRTLHARMSQRKKSDTGGP